MCFRLVVLNCACSRSVSAKFAFSRLVPEKSTSWALQFKISLFRKFSSWNDDILMLEL